MQVGDVERKNQDREGHLGAIKPEATLSSQCLNGHGLVKEENF